MGEIQPTPEDYEAARKEMERPAREIFLELEARRQAEKRLERERQERRHRLLRRLFPFRRAA